MNPLLKSAIIYALLLAAIIAGTKQFSAFTGRGNAARAHAEELKAAIAKAREEIKLRRSAQEDIERAKRALSKVDSFSIAPYDDSFAWARSEVARAASGCGVELLNIAESKDQLPGFLTGERGPCLVPFRLSMELKGGEEAALRFMRRIEDSSAYVQFHHFSIIKSLSDEQPMIFATIEWPAWTDANKAARVRAWRDSAVAQ